MSSDSRAASRIAGSRPLSRTCFSAIRELRPGTWLRLNKFGESRGCYWEWCDSSPRDWNGIDPVEALEACLTNSVRAHLESDVPVAAFLSGGIDSSLLVWLLSRHLGVPIATFNVGFDDRRYDESLHARAVAAYCGSNHQALRIQGGEGDPIMLVDFPRRRIAEWPFPVPARPLQCPHAIEFLPRAGMQRVLHEPSRRHASVRCGRRPRRRARADGSRAGARRRARTLGPRSPGALRHGAGRPG